MIIESINFKKQSDFPENTIFFPEYEDIFIQEQSWLKDHFLPLFTLDLGKLSKNFQGHAVHVVVPFEPYGGYIGGRTKEFHNNFTSENWIAFKVNDDGKYEFLGNEDYFEYNPRVEECAMTGKNYFEDAIKHFGVASSAFQKLKKHYQETKQVCYYNKVYDRFQEPYSFGSFGGILMDDNWTSNPPPAFSMFDYYRSESQCFDEPLSIVKDRTTAEYRSAYQVSYKKQPFYQVGWIDPFIPNAPQCPIMLYEPVNKIVLYTFQWT